MTRSHFTKFLAGPVVLAAGLAFASGAGHAANLIVPPGFIGGGMLAPGAVAANLGFTPLNPANANTFTAAQTVNAGSGAITALTTMQALSGSVTTAGLNANLFTINSDNVGTGSGGGNNNVNGFGIRHTFGGSNVNGARNAFFTYLSQNAVTSSSSYSRNYSAELARVQTTTGDGGTGLTISTAAGAYFAADLEVILKSGAINVLNSTALELDSDVETGASVFEKSVLQLGGADNDAVSGTLIDAILLINSGATTTSAYNDAILIGAPSGGNGRFPLASTGNILRTANSSTIGTGIDFSLSTITNYFLKGPGNFDVTGAGLIQAPTEVVAVTPTASQALGGTTPSLQQLGTSIASRAELSGGWGTGGGALFQDMFYISRNAAPGGLTTVAANDETRIRFLADDGATAAGVEYAKIAATVQAAAGTNQIAGELRFYTATAANPGVETLALTLDDAQKATFAGVAQTPGLIATSAAPTVSASQIGYGGTVAASSSCGSLASSAGCVVINVAGTTRYLPYY